MERVRKVKEGENVAVSIAVSTRRFGLENRMKG